MKKPQVDHVLRAAGRITGEKRFIIIGSQALHASYPDMADEIQKSAEVDLIATDRVTRAEWLNAIGYLSPFHEAFGYYADPVDTTTATLPDGWESRLIGLSPGDTGGVQGLCLDPHDLAISKYAAGREKDRIFTRELAARGLVSSARLLALLEVTPVEEDARRRIRSQIDADFQRSPGTRADTRAGEHPNSVPRRKRPSKGRGAPSKSAGRQRGSRRTR